MPCQLGAVLAASPLASAVATWVPPLPSLHLPMRGLAGFAAPLSFTTGPSWRPHHCNQGRLGGLAIATRAVLAASPLPPGPSWRPRHCHQVRLGSLAIATRPSWRPSHHLPVLGRIILATASLGAACAASPPTGTGGGTGPGVMAVLVVVAYVLEVNRLAPPGCQVTHQSCFRASKAQQKSAYVTTLIAEAVQP